MACEGISPECFKIVLFHGKLFSERSIPALKFIPFYFQKTILDLDSKTVLFEQQDIKLTLSSSLQDVLCELGNPTSIFYKEQHKLQIHTLQANYNASFDYFLNYFHLGLDILVDGSLHRIKKFVFHSNFVENFEYNRYSKCNLQIQKGNQAFSFSTKFEDLEKILGKPDGMPMVMNRQVQSNPFGSTKLYGYNDHGLVLEVAKSFVTSAVFYS